MLRKPFAWIVIGGLSGVVAAGLWCIFSKGVSSESYCRAVSEGGGRAADTVPTAVPAEAVSASGPSQEQVAPPLAPLRSGSLPTPTAGVLSGPPAPARPKTNAASPLVAGNEGAIDPGGVKDRYAANEILDERVGPVDASGQYERVRVVKTSMKYPLVRVVERIEKGDRMARRDTGVSKPGTENRKPKTNVPEDINLANDKLLSQTAMVADHVTLKVKEGTTEAQLAAYAQAQGGTILRKLRVPGPGTYLVAFDKVTVDTVPNAVAALSQPAAPVEYVNPDYVVYTLETFPNDPLFSQLYGMHNTSQIAGTGTVVSATNTVSGTAIVYSPVTNGVTGTLYYCGLGNPGDFPAGVSNNIALIQRGTLTFADKATNAKAKGAKAVIIYNNVSGAFSGTFSASGDWLPSLTISDTDGALLLTQTNTAVTVTVYGCKFDADIDAPEAWDISTGSTNIVVGVIDTGIDYNHPDLASNMWTNPGEIPGNGIDDDGNGFVDDIYGYDFAGDDGNPMDDYFHGTHCAGTIGGVGNNGIGVAGVCWNVRMMALKFLDASGGGNLSDAVEAIYYATSNGVKLTSNSWGGGGYDDTLRDAIADAGNRGIMFVAAAGNSAGDNDGAPTYPGSYDCSNIIAVAATDNNDALASFSCYGAASVDIGAPGVNILSCYPTYMTQAMTDRGDPTNYNAISGTSMATPHVAGACALLAAVHPELTLAQWRAQLLLQADPVPALEGKCVTGARLNVFRALTISATPILRLWRQSVTDPAPGGNGDGWINPGETGKVSVALINGGTNTATGVTATLTTTNPVVTVVSNTVTFGDIAGFSEGQSINDFVFFVATDCPPQMVSFQMVATDTAGGAWTNTILVRVRGMSRIAGTVTFNGAPAESYNVECIGTVESFYDSVSTDGEGHYSIDVLDGTYDVYATHPSIQLLASEAVRVTVPPDATNVDLSMLSATIAGRVTDARTGNPLADATVDYYVVGPAGEPPLWNSWVLRGSTTVDTNGEYSLTAVMGETSTVSVTAWAAGYSNSAPREVILPPGTQNVDFAMSAPDVNIGVTPAAVNAVGVLGQTITQTLVIANSGGASLPWTLWNESDEGNATAGQKIRTIKVASECVQPFGAAFDGNALSLLQDWRPKGLYRINPANGALLNAWSESDFYFILRFGLGLDWDGVNFWFSDYAYRKVVAVDPTTRKPVKSVDVCQNDASYQIAVVFGGGYLWAITRDFRVLKLNPRTGATLDSWQLPLTDAYGLEYFSGALWVLTTGSSGRIYKVSPTDGHVIRSFKSPHQYSFELAKDRAGNLWVANNEFDDAYAYLVRIGTAPWLTNSASSGTAPGGGSNTVQVTLNATTAGVGIHTAMVSVASSDPDEPEKLVPVTFTVTATRPPVIDTPAAATPNPVTLPATAALSVTAHDPDGDPLSYTWSKISGPGTVTFTPNGTAGSANSAAGFGVAGTYVLRVTVVSTNRTFEQATSDVTVYAAGIETDVAALSVPEGSNNTFRVRLVTLPAGSVTVAVARVSGDTDITVTNGAEIVFDTGNWSVWQIVTLAAGTDEDIENGSAVIALSAAGFATANVTATEQESGTILQVNAGVGGTVSPAGRNLVLIGVPVTVTATPDATHSFVRWVTTDGSATFANPLVATTTVTVAGPATIRANFNPPPGLSAWAWGYNADGELGDGTTTTRSKMVRVIYNSKPLTNITAISGGTTHSAALRGDGRVLTWGNNWYGQLGDGTRTNRGNPVLVVNLTNVSAIAAGGYHTLALTSDSNVWAWGRGDYGQLGNGTNSTPYDTPTPVPVQAQISNVTAIAGGWLFSLALKSDGSVWGWGRNEFSALGCVTTNTRPALPVQVSNLWNVVAIAAGAGEHAVALKADGTVWHWGTYVGTLPDPAYTPTQVPISNVIAIAAGYMHEVALKADGTVWTWGYWNISGQIGDGTINDWSVRRSTPTQVLISNVIAIASSGNHTLALQGDGSIWAWGDNVDGQCGDGTTQNVKPTPLQISGTRDFIGIAGACNYGGGHSLALREDQPYIRITNNVTSLTVPEGSTNIFRVKLDAQPWTNVTVTVIRASGDGDISVQSTNTLVFATNNWNSWQTVTLAAAEDNDASNGTAMIWLSGADFGSTVTVTEVENDTTLNVYAGTGGAVSPNGATVVTKGATNTISAIPNNGFMFTRWTVLSGSPVIADINASNTTATITAPATVQADFTSTNNDPPTADNQDLTTAEETAKVITLTGNDPEGSNLTFTVLSNPAQGALSGTAPNLTYTPTNNYNGADSFTFKVYDGAWYSGTATVSITVTGVNDAPIANGQRVFASPGVGKAITLTGSDIEGSNLTYAVVAQPGQGTLSGSAPALTYTSTNGFKGVDAFTFTVNDGELTSGTATVLVAVANSLPGMPYQFYLGTWTNLPNFDALTPSARGTNATFDISTRSTNDNFAFRFRGEILAWLPGSYTFYTASDDGSKLYINGGLIVTNDGLHGMTPEKSGGVTLAAGFHAIEVTMFENSSGEGLTVSWAGPGIAKQAIPSNVLFHPPAVTLTMTAGLGGTVSPTGAVTVAWGAATPVSATADYGYLFTNWTVTSGAAVFVNSNAANTLVAITTNATIQGNFIAAPLAIATDVSAVSVPEGGTNTFRVRLAAQPADDVTVTVVRSSGDGDITVQSGTSLVFATNTWSVWQTVTLAAAEDTDASNGLATITCSADGLSNVLVTATEADNDITSVVATGGTVTNYTENGTNYTAHIFTNSGTFEVTSGGAMEYLIVAGGGGGGACPGKTDPAGGGGGAGGMIVSNTTAAVSNFAIVVGGGGSGYKGTTFGPGVTGTNSTAFGMTALGGGGGGYYDNSSMPGISGGSGGGKGATHSTAENEAGGAGNQPGSASGGFGNAGGGVNGANITGTGGGGAGGAGTLNSAVGGLGMTNTFSGTAVYYAVGGAGCPRTTTRTGAPGAANTGNGGGAGGTGNSDKGGDGGSGIVIIRYVTGGGGGAPAAPTGLTATAAGTNRIELVWADNASNETGYVVDRSLDSNVWVFVTLTSVNATNHSDTGLATNTLYYYRVAASNAAGLSAYAYASATTWTAYEAWRRAYFTSAELGDPDIGGDNADPDHDHFPNLKEFLAGTIPTNGASYLGIMQFTANVGAEGGYVVRWQSASNRWYTLQAATNLMNGFTLILGSNIPATPPDNVHTDSVVTTGCRFYRVKVQ